MENSNKEMTAEIYTAISDATTNRWGHAWFCDNETSRLVDEAAAAGWVRRPSETQCEWTEEGIAEARRRDLTFQERAVKAVETGNAFDLLHDENYQADLRSAKYGGMTAEVAAVKSMLEKAAYIEREQDIEPKVSDKYEVGAILDDCWGYEQTNIDFYMVIKRTKTTVTIIPVKSQDAAVPGMDMRTRKTPDAVQWHEKPIRKKVHTRDGKEIGFSLRDGISGGWVSLWGGHAMTATSYA